MTIQTIKAKKLEWSDEKLMNWHEAKEYEIENKDGWRFPTLRELIDAVDDKIQGFYKGYLYWSSSDSSESFAYYAYVDSHGYVYTGNGFKVNQYSVRFVREVNKGQKERWIKQTGMGG